MQERNIGYFFIVFASIIIVLAGIKSASAIIVPFLLSLFIAIILSPLYAYINKKGLPSIISLTIVIGLFLIFLISVAKLIGNSAQEFSANISFYEQQLSAVLHQFVEVTTKYGIEIPEAEISNIINTKQIMQFSSTIIQSIGSLFTNGFVILLSVVFMLLESQNFIGKILSITKNTMVINNIKEITNKIKSYMVLKTVISLFTGLIIWISLYIIGTDYAFLWAVLAFMLNFIPNIGSIIAAVPAVLLTLVQLGSISALIVSGIYVGVNIIIGSVIEPKIMGKGLGLSTLVVFLSLLFWGWLLGIVGMLLSIPLTIMMKIIFYEKENTKWIAVLLGSGDNLKNDNK
ncbi:AI-2E family transporter [Sulfurimonas sp.]|uniref:AI-2E family transporter n=1 Tax=Sulfurimonas sp. TaxID=2022749 RepID=UPI002B45A946|nr:AI-2E family transporter [Sulfurimonas sp.]